MKISSVMRGRGSGMRSHAMPIVVGLFGDRHFGRASHNHGARLQILRCAQDAFPQIICGGYGQPHRFAFLFRDGQHFGEEQLLDGTEKLIGCQVAFAGTCAPQMRTCKTTISARPRLARCRAASSAIKRVVRAHRHEDVAGLHSHILWCQVGFLREVELIEFYVSFAAASFEVLFGKLEAHEQAGRKRSCQKRWLPAW